MDGLNAPKINAMDARAKECVGKQWYLDDCCVMTMTGMTMTDD